MYMEFDRYDDDGNLSVVNTDNVIILEVKAPKSDQIYKDKFGDQYIIVQSNIIDPERDQRMVLYKKQNDDKLFVRELVDFSQKFTEMQGES